VGSQSASSSIATESVVFLWKQIPILSFLRLIFALAAQGHAGILLDGTVTLAAKPQVSKTR